MVRKIAALLLAALIALFALTACRKGGETTSTVGDVSTSAEDTTTAGEKEQTTASKDKKDKASTTENSGSDESGTPSKSEPTTKKQSKKTDGWEQQENGDIVKGDVKVNVVRYAGASLDNGQYLIDQLIKAGLKNSKVLSSEKTANSIITKASGKRIGSDEEEFVKFQFVVEGDKAYLVTVIAEKQADLDTDISYVLSNLAELAE